MGKFVLSEMKDSNFSECAYKIYLPTSFNKDQYPNYFKWFYQINLPRILSGHGEAIFYLDAFQIVGLSMFKKNSDETKICTLLINEDYRKKGYSSLILKDSFEYLGTEKSLITIPKGRIDEFSKIIDAYGWIEGYTTDEYFSPEIFFNNPKVLHKKI